ncbi:MAG TPA: UvrB/UvrC motif-containing protein [Gemmatimonadales bacterium]|jgi:protein arginine kinase activator|nr:UvrB/UvrC motif-containing protein [Gemmatimonadales bacterium]
MKCSNCGEREGVVSLTQIEQGDVRTVSLCAKCAAEKGIETGVGISETPLGGFLAALGENLDPDAPLTAALELHCSGCGATLRDFRETGRVGCAECYRSFDAPLRELLRRLHGSTHHTGMRYAGSETAPPTVAVPAAPSQRELRDQLRQAIEAEQFELAAELRDRLREQE